MKNVSLVGLGARTPREESAASLLLGCHARIRTLLELAGRLAEAEAGDPQAPEAAERLCRYFAIALPLHVADEEESVRPRLEHLDEVQAALETMSREHEEIEDTLAELNEKWRAIAGGKPAATRDAVAQLAAHMDAHLKSEESIVFPAIALLAPETQSAIADEIHARRRNP